MSPFDSWLLLRGIETLALRVQAQQASAKKIALNLADHDCVTAVHYVGLVSHPGYEVHNRQSSGPGSVFSIELRDANTAKAVLRGTNIFTTAVSFGSTSIDDQCASHNEPREYSFVLEEESCALAESGKTFHWLRRCR